MAYFKCKPGLMTDGFIQTKTGAIVHIDDALAGQAKSVKVAIEPVQDLNGYNNPWPAGGGKNLFDSSLLTDAGWTEANGAYTGSSADIKQSVIPNFLKASVPAGQRITVSFDVLNDNVDRAGYFWILYDDSSKDFVECSANASTWTHKTKTSASGKNVSEVYFGMSNSVNFSLKNIQIEYSTSETSFAPYKNICPANGLTECKIARVGKNIFNPAVFTDNGGVLQEDGSYYVANQSSIYKKHIWDNNGYTGQIAITWWHKDNDTASSIGSYPRIFYTDGTSSNPSPLTVSPNAWDVATLVSNASKTVDYVDFGYSSNKSGYYYGQIELGSTLTEYEPFNAQVYTIVLDGTCYGGTLDVTTGKLTVDRVIKVFDGTEDFNFINDAQRRFIFRDLPALGSSNETTVVQKGLISHGVFQSSWSGTWGHFRLNSGTYLGFLDKDTYFESVSDLQTYLASEYANGTPVQVVYPLDTPVEVDLTPTEITLFAGTNNLWSDAGETTVKYKSE